MASLSQVKQVMLNLFKATAKKNNVALKEVQLFFLLKRVDKFICRYGDNEVPFSDAGTLATLYSGKVNRFISEALGSLAGKNGIPLPHVNVLMQVTGTDLEATDLFVLILRNGNDVVCNIEIEQLINL